MKVSLCKWSPQRLLIQRLHSCHMIMFHEVDDEDGYYFRSGRFRWTAFRIHPQMLRQSDGCVAEPLYNDVQRIVQ